MGTHPLLADMGHMGGPLASRDCPWWSPPVSSGSWWVTNPASGGCDCSPAFASGSLPLPSDLHMIPLRGNALLCPQESVLFLPGPLTDPPSPWVGTLSWFVIFICGATVLWYIAELIGIWTTSHSSSGS